MAVEGCIILTVCGNIFPGVLPVAHSTAAVELEHLQGWPGRSQQQFLWSPRSAPRAPQAGLHQQGEPQAPAHLHK